MIVCHDCKTRVPEAEPVHPWRSCLLCIRCLIRAKFKAKTGGWSPTSGGGRGVRQRSSGGRGSAAR